MCTFSNSAAGACVIALVDAFFCCSGEQHAPEIDTRRKCVRMCVFHWMRAHPAFNMLFHFLLIYV